MDTEEARRRFAAAPVARLATVRPDGRPHLVPVTFALLDEHTVVFAVDHKPKGGTRLQRLRNIADEPRVSLLVDHYDEAWSRLWWVRADGRAEVLDGGPRHDAGIAALVGRYPQYHGRPPAGPVVLIVVSRWRGWGAAR